ncbi:MAG: DUF721 domain-containing protein [Rikenella sp.]|nr:DUF721 domain-containing protein [Rikenella sp.]
MRRTEPTSIGQLLEDFFRQRAAGAASMEGRAVEVWSEAAGPYVARHTEDVYIRNGTLYVGFSSAAVRAEIFMSRKQLAGRINRLLQAEVVRRIVVR